MFAIDTGQLGPVSAKPYTVPLAYWDRAKAELSNMEILGEIHSYDAVIFCTSAQYLAKDTRQWM